MTFRSILIAALLAPMFAVAACHSDTREVSADASAEAAAASADQAAARAAQAGASAAEASEAALQAGTQAAEAAGVPDGSQTAPAQTAH
jgi:hypothetical protein